MSALDDAPPLWWSPTGGLIRGGTNGGYEDAEPLTPAARRAAGSRGFAFFCSECQTDSGHAPTCSMLLVGARPVDDTRARQLVSDLATIGRQVETGYSLRIERYRGDPEDAVYAILKWGMSGTAGIIAWNSEVASRAPTMAGAVRDAVEQTGWTENPRGDQHADPAQP